MTTKLFSEAISEVGDIPQRAAEKIDCPFSMPTGRKEQPTMTKPREKTREELTAEIEDGKKKIRQFENREKVLRRKLSIVNNSTHFDISKSTLALCCVLSAAQGFFRF